MQKAPEEIDRRVVPRWRHFSETSAVELESAHSQTPGRVGTQDIVALAERKWELNPSIENAAELVGAAVLFGRSNQSGLAARQILQSGEATNSVSAMAHSHLAEGTSTDKTIDTSDPEKIRKRIKSIRSILKDYPRNSILQVEVARAYVTLGQLEAATRNIDVALGAQEENRFVVRSAVRFFVHIKDWEEHTML